MYCQLPENTVSTTAAEIVHAGSTFQITNAAPASTTAAHAYDKELRGPVALMDRERSAQHQRGERR